MLALLWLGALGLVWGSFAQQWISRTPPAGGAGLYLGGRRLGLRHPRRSLCLHCWQAIRWRDNLPLLSYAWLRGRCRHCRQPIGWDSPATELLCGSAFALWGALWTQGAWTPWARLCPAAPQAGPEMPFAAPQACGLADGFPAALAACGPGGIALFALGLTALASWSALLPARLAGKRTPRALNILACSAPPAAGLLIAWRCIF